MNAQRLAAPVMSAGILAGAALGLAGTAAAQPQNDTITYDLSGVTASIDCGHGGALQVSGSHDVLTVTGSCSALHISGDANRLTVAGVTDIIDLSGSGNTVNVTADFDGSTLAVGGNNNYLNTGTD